MNGQQLPKGNRAGKAVTLGSMTAGISVTLSRISKYSWNIVNKNDIYGKNVQRGIAIEFKHKYN